MLAKSHVTTTLALSLPWLALSHQLNEVNVVVVCLGSLLPDIDHPKSYLGQKSRVVSEVTNKTFGHRGATHSLLAAFLVLLVGLFCQRYYLPKFMGHVAFWLTWGYLCHLLEDGFSKLGIRWFYPFQKKPTNLLLGVVYYRTATWSEQIIFWGMLAMLMYEVHLIINHQINHFILPRWQVVSYLQHLTAQLSVWLWH